MRLAINFRASSELSCVAILLKPGSFRASGNRIKEVRKINGLI